MLQIEMNRCILLFCLVMVSCNHSMYNSKKYELAKQELEYLDYPGNYKAMPPNAILYKTWIFNRDTIVLQKREKVFGFKNKRTKDIYIFEFFDDNWHRRIKFDSLWNIIEYKGLTGFDY